MPNDEEARKAEQIRSAEQQRILQAIHTLDEFAASTPLPRAWHAQWQGVYQQVVKKIRLLGMPPVEAEPNPPAEEKPQEPT